MKVINLTDHDVNICDRFGYIIKTYKPSGTVARYDFDWVDCGTIDGVPIVRKNSYGIVGLPERQEDTIYIVSNLIRDIVSYRSDLYSPAEMVRCDGRIVGCRALSNG